jgi:KUP system potassium uptake protein
LGGVFALKALLTGKRKKVIMLLTGGLLILSAGLLFGDGVITPAISVLSAVEGLKVAEPALANFVVPITCVILVGLFAIQFLGASKVGRFFGPIVSVWFVALALLGINQIVHDPEILVVFNPLYALHLFAIMDMRTIFIILGSIMLVVTGGEALYADMGHFGKRPIRFGWFLLVYPALMLNYLGQGGYLLSGAPIQAGNLFFSLVPSVLVYPMVVLATLATIIASQALISGVFSLVVQGISLNLLPRIRILHTHEDHEGQVYVPFINWVLCIGCVILVIAFKTSANLASAYGLAVAGDMFVTSLSMIAVTYLCWEWPLFKSLLIFVPLVIVDASFLSANSLKILTGGYVPLTIGVCMFIIMKTWHWGRSKVRAAYEAAAHMTVGELVRMKTAEPQHYFPRSVIVLTQKFVEKKSDNISGLLQLLIDNYGVVPKHLIMLTIDAVKTPEVAPEKRYKLKVFEKDGRIGTVASVRARFGFMEIPEIKQVIEYLNSHPEITVNEDVRNWVVFAGHERLMQHKGASIFEKTRFAIFKVLHRNAVPAYTFFGLDDELSMSTETLSVKV